jgi:hypothetical protein
MSTDLPPLPSDAQLLYEYLGQRVDEHRSAREVLDALQAYSAQLGRLREMIREAEESLSQGLAKELDVSSLLDRVRQRVPLEGSSD